MNNNQPYYFHFSRAQAEMFLGDKTLGTFLVRPTASSVDHLALSQKTADGILHAKIACVRHAKTKQIIGYSVGADAEIFASFDDLLRRVQTGARFVLPPASNTLPQPTPQPQQKQQPTPPQLLARQSAQQPPQPLRPTRPAVQPTKTPPPPPTPIRAPAPRRPQQLPLFPVSSPLNHSVQIPINEVGFDKELGAGSFGVVFKYATWLRLNSNTFRSSHVCRGHWREWTVALKHVRNSDLVQSDDFKAFITEAEMMATLPPHPNVVRFVGIVPPPK